MTRGIFFIQDDDQLSPGLAVEFLQKVLAQYSN